MIDQAHSIMGRRRCWILFYGQSLKHRLDDPAGFIEPQAVAAGNLERALEMEVKIFPIDLAHQNDRHAGQIFSGSHAREHLTTIKSPFDVLGTTEGEVLR